MPKRLKIALLIETSNDYARGLLHGVVAYMREHATWSIYLAEHGRGDTPPAWLDDWNGHGIIARIENKKIANAVKRCGLPTVDLSAARLVPDLPWVETDDEAIAHLAAEHLLERGFKHFAYCGDPKFNWSKWRGEAFAKFLKKAGYACDIYNPPKRKAGSSSWASNEADIARWLRKLPKPLGVMACYDVRGQQLLDACRRVDIGVPDEVAVVGVDNDEVLCHLADPPLSSVIPATRRTGYEAARLLDRMMQGEVVEADAYLIEPLGIATRQSTDVLAIDDTDISNAVRFIREHACEGINVDDLMRQIPMSRRVLESRFHKLIGRTPHEQIMRTQINRVKQLLTETQLPLTAIAKRTGFKHAEYLSVVFKKKVGLPPGAYRTQNQGRVD